MGLITVVKQQKIAKVKINFFISFNWIKLFLLIKVKALLESYAIQMLGKFRIAWKIQLFNENYKILRG